MDEKKNREIREAARRERKEAKGAKRDARLVRQQTRAVAQQAKGETQEARNAARRASGRERRAAGESLPEGTVIGDELIVVEIIDRVDAPPQPPLPLGRWASELTDVVNSLELGRVARIEPMQGERPRKIVNHLYRMAGRIGRPVTTWEDDRFIYVELVDIQADAETTSEEDMDEEIEFDETVVVDAEIAAAALAEDDVLGGEVAADDDDDEPEM